MSNTVDDRVVNMRMNAKGFTDGAESVGSALDKLKQKLSFKGADKGFENVNAAAKNVDLSSVANGVENLNSKFSLFGVAAATVMAKVTDATVRAGHAIVSTLTEGIRGGFQEYETQLDSVQTVLANTASKGTTLEQVNSALNTLNTYADKTIYNFTEMTRNIGTFTAAGVDLQTSVDAIQGIANLAAMSGSSSQQASMAMYQLSQALAAGTVKLMDWNSVVNAGMGGEVFQSALIRTSEHLKTGAKAAIQAQGSFRDSLQTGWLTQQVLTDTLRQFSLSVDTAEDYNNSIKDLMAEGYTQEEAKSIADMAKTAGDAATKVKTFSQLIDTLREAIGSGWTQSWQTFIGDFEEAKDLWTGVNDQLSAMVSNASNARNQLLTSGLASGWNQFLQEGIEDSAKYKEVLTQTARDHGVAIDEMITKNGSLEKTFKNGWLTGDMLKESVGKMTDQISNMNVEQLKSAGYTKDQVRELQNLNKKLQDGSISADDFAKKMARTSGRENIFNGLETAFSSLVKVIGAVHDAFADIFPPMTGDQLYNLTVRFKNFTDSLKPSSETIDEIKRTFKGLFAVVDLGLDVLRGLGSAFGKVVGSSGGFVSGLLRISANLGDLLVHLHDAIESSGIFAGVFGSIGDVLGAVTALIGDAVGHLGSLSDLLGNFKTTAFDAIGKSAENLHDILSGLFDWIQKNITSGDIFGGIASGSMFVASKKFSDLAGNLSDGADKIVKAFTDPGETLKGEAKELSEALDIIKDSLVAFTGAIKATTLLEIATALTLMVSSLMRIAKLKVADISKGVTTIGILMVELNLAFTSISKTLSKFRNKGMVRAGLALIAFAKALDIMSSAMQKYAKLNLGQVIVGLSGMAGSMIILSKAAKALGNSVSLKTSVTLLALAQSMKMLAEPIKELGSMPWKGLVKGLGGMAGALGLMTAAVKVMGMGNSKVGLSQSVAFLAIAKSMGMIGDALKSVADIPWKRLAKSLAAMGGALGEITLTLGVLSKVSGLSSIFAAGSIYIVISGLQNMAKGLQALGTMEWGDIGHSLVAMGGALAEIAVVNGALGKIAGLSSIFGAASIWITTQGLVKLYDAFHEFSLMEWGSIGKGLVAMGGALAEVSAITGGLGKIAGLSGIIGSATIWATEQSLNKLYEAFNGFASRSWGSVGRGLVAMGGALAEVSVISGGLGKLAGLSGIIGAGTIWIAIQGLDKLASAMQKFGSMSWTQVGQGLVAMGGALAEIALVSGSLGFLGGIAGMVGAGTINLAVQGLDQLADALIKFGSMSWDQISKGISAMVSAMGATGLGALLNTFSGFGADAIATVAQPLGVLADSVMKWQDVQLPDNLTSQLGQLATGIMAFTLGGIGASGLATAAPAVGQMADSIRKWQNVTIPPGLEDGMKSIANGIMSFSFAFLGGFSLSTAAGPLGDLAGSIQKWNNVAIPPGLEGGLRSIANGIMAFSFAFLGGFSLSTIIGPLGDLAGAIKKWNGIAIPGGIESGMQSIANGVKAFTWTFVGGLSLGSVIGPLGDLGKVLHGWNGISIPGGIQSGLEGIANGVKAFSGSGDGASTMGSAANGLKNLATAVSLASAVNFAGVSAGLLAFVGSINSMPPISTTIPQQITDLGNQILASMTSLGSNVTIGTVGAQSAFVAMGVNLASSVNGASQTLMGSLNGLSSGVSGMMANLAGVIGASSGSVMAAFAGLSVGAASSLAGLSASVSSEMSGMAGAVSSSSGATSAALAGLAATIAAYSSIIGASFSGMVTATRQGLNLVVQTIISFNPQFQAQGRSLASSLGDGLRQGSGNYSSAVTGGLASAVSSVRSFHGAFHDAGVYAVSGLAQGMLANRSAVINAGTQLGNDALNAAKEALKEHSPSKAFHQIGDYGGQGLVNGLNSTRDAVQDSGKKLGNAALGAVQDMMRTMANIDMDDLDVNPTITPVLDLSSVQQQAQGIGDLLSASIPLDGIRSQVNRLAAPVQSDQNGKNSEQPVEQTVVNNYNFNQTNNSPKLPSRADLRRDGKNLVRQLEYTKEMDN